MNTRSTFIARRIKQTREHIKRVHACEGITPYVRDLLACLHTLMQQAQAL